jgi:hypothetical protein
MADIKYTVTIDAATGAAEIKKLEAEFDRLGATVKKGGDDAAGAGPKHKSFIDQIAIGNIIASAGSKILHTFWNELKSVVTAAAESEAENVRLDMALFSTGRQVAQLNEYYKAQAEALMKVTTYDDEAIKGAQAMLLQLTNLNRDGIDKATRGTIGLATVFKMDLVNASELVAKWMSGNTDRLSKYGIHVNDTMSAEKKRNEILKQLAVYYQQAEAATGTYAGKLLQLKNNYGELKEEIGRYFTENVKLVDVLNEVTQGLYDFFEAGKKYKRELVEQEKENIEWGNRIYEAAIKAGKTRYEIEQMMKSFPGLTKEQKYNADNMAWSIKLGEWGQKMKAEYIKIEEAYNKAIAEQNRLRKEGEGGRSIGPTPEEVAAAKKHLEEVKKIHQNAREWLMKNYQKWVDDQKEKTKEVTEVHQKAREALMKGERDWLEKQKKNQEDIKNVHIEARQFLEEDRKKWIEREKERIETIKQKWMEVGRSLISLFQSLAALQQANTDAEMARVNQTYEARKKAILDSTMDEEKKAAAIKNLETEQDLATRKIQREAAVRQKNISITATIMNTAEAVVAALTAKPWGPWNIVMAAIVAAKGAIELATIKSQPIPLQAGAYTMGQGLAYLHPHEIVSPETKMKEVFREVIHERVQAYQPNIRVRIGEREIKDFIVDTVDQAFRRRVIGRSIIQ